MGGSKQTQATSSSANPWGPAQGPLQGIIGRASELGGDASNFMPTFSGATMQGIAGLEQAGQQPGAAATYLNPVVSGMGQGFQTGLDQMTRTASGANLEGNPYLREMLDYANQNTANRVNQQFSGAGRYGSGAHTGSLAREIGAQTTQALMNNYNTERGYQNAAAGTLYGGGAQGAQLAGALDQANLFDENALIQAGQMRDQIANQQRIAPMTALEWERSQIQPIGSMGGTQQGTSVTQTPANIPGMIIGGGMTALGLYNANPFNMFSSAGTVGKGILG